MKSEVFEISGGETMRGGKEEGFFTGRIQDAIDAFLGRGGKGFVVVALNVSVDIASNIKKAIVTIIYDGELKAAKTAK